MSEYEKEIQKVTESMHHAFLNEETRVATALRNEGEQLTQKMFQENANIPDIAEKLNHLAKKMLDFETSIINFEILFFLYADIGRVALNLQAFDVAIRYALAGIDANESIGDQEGVLANKRLLLDIACFMGANVQAVELIKSTPELDTGGLHQLLSGQGEDKAADQEFFKLANSKNRPKTFAFCVDAEKRQEEKAIRTVMKQTGDSRATVLKYLAAAMKLDEDKR